MQPVIMLMQLALASFSSTKSSTNSVENMTQRRRLLYEALLHIPMF